MTKLILVLALISTPSLALAGKTSGSTAQKHADAARASAAKHAEKGNTSAAKNMAKIADQRQKAADRANRKKR